MVRIKNFLQKFVNFIHNVKYITLIFLNQKPHIFMKTITDCVQEILKHDPFLEDALSRNIINFSSLALDLTPKIEKKLRKPVKPGSIVMALRRYTPEKKRITTSLQNLGDIVVRSDITDYTFANSKTIVANQSLLLDKIKDKFGVYFTYANNYHESNIIVSSSLKGVVEDYFKDETCIGVKDELSSLSIALPAESSKIVGLYFSLFRILTFEGIPIFEVISTSNYFTLFFEKTYVNKAFVLISEMKNKL